MRTVIAVLALVVLFGFAGPVRAEGHGDGSPADSHPLSITLDLVSVGGGIVGLVVASGIVNLFNAGALMTQGTPIIEAMEAGAGLPLPVTALAVILGAVFCKDIVTKTILPIFVSNEHGKPTH